MGHLVARGQSRATGTGVTAGHDERRFRLHPQLGFFLGVLLL